MNEADPFASALCDAFPDAVLLVDSAGSIMRVNRCSALFLVFKA